MRKPTVNSDSVAQDQLRAFVERIMRMREEARAINDDIREIYAEAKGNGFDKTVLGQVVSYVEKRAKDADTLAERSALFDLYLDALDAPRPHARARAREIIDEFDPETGEVIEPNSNSAEASQVAAGLSGEGGANPPSLADTESTAALTEVRDNSTEASAAPHSLDPVAATTPPAGEAPPVDTNSKPGEGKAGAIPATAIRPTTGEALNPQASPVRPRDGLYSVDWLRRFGHCLNTDGCVVAPGKLCKGCSAALTVTAGGEAIAHHGSVGP